MNPYPKFAAMIATSTVVMFGLMSLSHWQPAVVYSATIGVMVFGSLGVLNALRKGLDLECACMGSILKVPLSTVAFLEDLGMAAMAAAMLVMRR